MQLNFSIYEVLNRDTTIFIKFRCSLCSCTIWSEKEYDIVPNQVPSDYIKHDEELLNKLRQELKCMVEKSQLNFTIDIESSEEPENPEENPESE